MRLTAEKTAAGGDVFAVGVPRFQLVDAEGNGSIIVRAQRHSAFATDAQFIAIWDAATGAPLRRIAPNLEDFPYVFASVAVSANGEWLAAGSSHVVRIFQAPFDKPAGELACATAYAFSHSGKLLACATNVLGVWDIATHQLVASMSAGARKGIVHTVRFSTDDHALVWTTEHAVLRWDFAGAGAVTPIYQPAARIENAAIADGGSAAYVNLAGKTAVILDLASGKTASTVSDYGVAISPSGQRLARASNGVRVIDAASGNLIWTAKLSSPATRLAFGETDDTIGYVEGGRLRVATLPGAPIVPAQPTRVAGWLGAGIAAVEHDGALRSFALATHAWGPADRAAILPQPPTGAPAWASWIAGAAGGAALAAEPSKRHELTPDRRGLEACNAKQRVWTPTGGAKTLTMTCTKSELDDHEDPGWDIGGGWAVGVSATTATIYDARTGRRVAALPVPPRKVNKPEFAPAYWQMALAPAGDWLALIWRRADLEGSHGTEPPDPRDDAVHVDETLARVDCISGERGGCQREYFVELWSLKGSPKRVWQARLEHTISSRQMTEPAVPTGALAFDHTGEHFFIGFDDGEIRIVSAAAPETPRIERLHSAPIRALSIDPSGGWVFSADAAGEQRLWKLAP